MDNNALFTTLDVLVGISVLIQVLLAIGGVVAILAVRKSIAEAKQTANELKASVVPIIHNTRDLVQRISPQVVSITGDISELTQLLRKETVTVKDSVNEMVDRVNKQTQRLDTMLTSSLNAVDRAGNVIESAVSTPVRQANGIFAALKAVIETYRSVDPRKSSVVKENGYEAPVGYSSSSKADKDYSI